MAEPTQVERPLSPHLQIYRPQMVSMSSILTRITGNALIAGYFVGVVWLLAAAIGPEEFAFVNGLVTSWLGDLVMTGLLAAMWYHYLAGLRHFYYDAGKGLDIPTAEKLGWGLMIGTVVLTGLTVLLV
jgi:succinate dehydrogenase / fumarate reductase cytochrome b subunit